MEYNDHDCESREDLLEKSEDLYCPRECRVSTNLHMCKEKQYRRIYYCMSLLSCLICITTAFTVILLDKRTCDPARPKSESITALDHATYPHIAQCGSSPAEAVEKGCVFDPMAAAYLPPACYDRELFLQAQHESTSNYLSWKLNDPYTPRPAPETFEWFIDQDLTIPIAQSDIPTTSLFQAFTWERYHIAHCEYVATQLLKAARRISQGEKNVYVNSGALNEAHRRHCRYVLGEQIRRVGDVALVSFGYGNCTRLI